MHYEVRCGLYYDADICKFSGAKHCLRKNILANWYLYENGKVALEMLGAADIPEEYKEEGKGPKPLVDKDSPA